MIIILLMKQISRASGGLSSALDLAETMFALKHDIYLCVSSASSPWRKKQNTTIPQNKIREIPSSYSRVGKVVDKSLISIFNDKKSSARARINRTLRFFRRNRTEQDFERLLKQADLIFDFENFTAEAINKIRFFSKAKLVRNHAGAPDTFENYWVRNEHLDVPQETSGARYVEYCKRYDLLLFQAEDQAFECAKRDPLLRSKCYVLSPSCSEMDVLAADQLPSPYQPEKKIIVAVGSLQQRKAQHDTLEVFKWVHQKVPSVELHFVGGNEKTEYGKNLISSARQMGLESVVFLHGFQADYLRWMAHANVIIQTSLSEGVSRVLRESMLMHLPIVSFSISGTKSILRTGQDALLFEPGDFQGMSSAISLLLSDNFVSQSISKSAFDRYLLNHSCAKYAFSVNQMISNFRQ